MADKILDEEYINIKHNGNVYYGILTMESFKVFKEITGLNLLSCMSEVFEYDENITLALLGAVLRREKGEAPIGKEILGEEFGIGFLLENYSKAPLILVNALPKAEGNTDKPENNKKK